MKIIGRNQKNKAYKIFNNAKNIRSYSLENGFTGKNCNVLDYEGKNWLIRKWEQLYFSKLIEESINKYELYIHSNYWVKFEN